MPRVYDHECPRCGQMAVLHGHCQTCRWSPLDAPETPTTDPIPPTTGPTDAPARDPEPAPGDPYPHDIDERGDADTDDTDLWNDLGPGG